MDRRDTDFTAFDLCCMKRAFTLARRAEGQASPNPLVGAVIAREGRLIGEGWHQHYGGPHAEAEAIAAVLRAGETLRGATLYCTLEPCAFSSPQKHQSPCTRLVIENRIGRVVIANQDPHSQVNGRGVRALRKAGITVHTGLLSARGEELNRDFFTFQRLGRPFIHLKIAQSLDGKIAPAGGTGRTGGIKPPPGPVWITDEAARKIVHRLRGRYDAVLIGRAAAMADDPELTVRLARGRNPLRVVLDSRLKLPFSAKLFGQRDPEKTLVFCATGADAGKTRRIRDTGASVIPLTAGADGLPLPAVLAALGERGVRSVLVEGGRSVFSSFLREGLWDRLSVFIAPLILGGGIPCVQDISSGLLADAVRPGKAGIKRIGDQILFEGNNVYRNR